MEAQNSNSRIYRLIHLILYGTENRVYPETYFEEQNYQCSRLLPLLSLVTTFIWLPYIPLDQNLHPEAEAIPYLRVGLSLVSVVCFTLYWIPYFRKRAIYLIMLLGAYAIISTGILTGLTKGDASYMGGYNILIMGSLFVPAPLIYYYSAMLLSVGSFFLTLYLKGVHILEDVPVYSFNDLISALILAFIFAYLLDRDRYSYYRKSLDRERQRKQIENQATLISDKNEELTAQERNLRKTSKKLRKANADITASINYAKRIQDAMQGNSEVLKKWVNDYFIMYLPRDTVSGDFYFFGKENNKLFVVLGDCTGHGIPGAFMSLIGQSLMEEIIHTHRLSEPDEILSLLKQKLEKRLNQKETSNRDGMDIAICVIERTHTKLTLEYAGAKIPLLLVRDGKIERTKGDSIMIGGNYKNVSGMTFTKHKIDITSATTIYLCSDGYQDQFGGQDNRKFTSHRLRNLLQEIHQRDMNIQKQILLNTYNNWKKNGRQIDDISLLGLRIEP